MKRIKECGLRREKNPWDAYEKENASTQRNFKTTNKGKGF